MQSKQKIKISFQELAYTNMIQIEALANMLVQKNICTKEELIEEVKKIKVEQALRQSKRDN